MDSFNQFSLGGHLVLFLTVITNTAIVHKPVYKSFCNFFSITLSWFPKRRIIESSSISIYNYAEHLHILFGESLGAVLFCVPTIKA